MNHNKQIFDSQGTDDANWFLDFLKFVGAWGISCGLFLILIALSVKIIYQLLIL